MKIFVAAIFVFTICLANLVNGKPGRKYDIKIRRAEQCRELQDLPVVFRNFSYNPPLSVDSTKRKISAFYSVNEKIQNQPIYFQRETWSCKDAEKEPKIDIRHGQECSPRKKEPIVPLKCGKQSPKKSAEGRLRKALDKKNPCFDKLGDYILKDLLVCPENAKAQEQQYNHLEVNYYLYTSDLRRYLCIHVHADRVLKKK